MAVNINIPSQVKTYANLAAFPATGALKTIYIAEDTNKTYRWTGSIYTEISASAAMTWGAIGGTLSNQTDLQSALDAKVPASRTLTINGVTQDLSANRTFTISTGITIGTTAIASGTVGRVLFEGAGNVVQESSSLFWDATNNRLGIGTSTPSAILHSVGSVTASSAIARGNFFNNTLVASANNDVLVGLDIQPTFTNGAFTGLENIPLRFVSQSNSNVVKNILLKNIGTGNGTGVSIGFNNLNANNLSHAFIKSYYVVPSGMAMSFGTGGGSSLTSEGTTALVLNADQTANFTGRVIANSGGFQAIGTSVNMLMSDNGTPVITRNGGTGIQFLKDAYWQTFSIFTNNTENLRVASTGNVLIGTTTDAGFRLDVNGTARVQGNLTAIGAINSVIQHTALTNYVGFGGFQLNVSGGAERAFAKLNPDSGEFKIGTTGSGYFTTIHTGGVERLRVFASTGNVGINTTTDAGFRLDVNGTARVATSILVGASSTQGTMQTGVFRGTYFNDYANNFTIFQVQSNGNASFYQGLAIGTSANAVASAQVEIVSTTKGFLPPRMTTTQRNAIASPAAGLMVYDTTLNVIMYYNGSMWI